MNKPYKFESTICPVCKKVHEALLVLSGNFVEHRCSDCRWEPYAPGQKVRLYPEKTIHTVEHFDDNLCGDGCCTGYKLSGVEEHQWPMDVEGVYED